MAAFTASQASVTNGSKVVTINSGESTANIRQGDFLVLGTFSPVEILRGYVSTGGVQSLELIKAWDSGNQSNQKAIVIPTTVEVRAAVTALQSANTLVNDNFAAMQDWQTKTGTVTFTNQDGTTSTIKTLKQMENEANAQLAEYHPYPWAMRKVEFEARRAANNEKFAASGFVHKGRHYGVGVSTRSINQGMWCYSEGSGYETSNLYLGSDGINQSQNFGESKENLPILNVAGVVSRIRFLGTTNAYFNCSVKFPPAEAGTRTYDSATGVSVTHATPAIAFASETATNKVVTDRVDMWGFEAFLREINDADPFVYENGLIQSLATNINGVTTVTDNVRPDTYFAWYEGDTTSRGKGVNWQTATEAQRRVIASDPENNIYFDDATGKFYQWSPRGRSFAGVGNGDWSNLDTTKSPHYLDFSPIAHIRPRGLSNTILDEGLGYPLYATEDASASYGLQGGQGVFGAMASSSSKDTGRGVNGQCYFLVCGTVNRLNQGAYHPSHNPSGSNLIHDNAGNTTAGRSWSEERAKKITSKLDAFILSGSISGLSWGNASSGLSGRPDGRFYDASYASGAGGVCRDMRYSAWGLTQEDFAGADLSIKSGEYRGRENPSFVKVGTVINSAQSVYSGGVTKLITAGQRYSAEFEEWDGYDVSSVGINTGIYGCYIVDANGSLHSLQACSIRINSDAICYIIGNQVASFPAGTYSIVITRNDLKLPSIAGDSTHTEVIGDPANILQCDDLKDGWVGNWLPVLADGTSKKFPLTRPLVEQLPLSYTVNNGSTWTNYGSWSSLALFDQIKNEWSGSFPTNGVYVINYKTKAGMTQDSANRELYGGKQGIGNVFITQGYLDWAGADLGYSLIGKILDSTGDGNSLFFNNIPLNDFKIYNGKLGGWTSNEKANPTHTTDYNFGSPENSPVAFKALNYNVVKNQQGFINYAYTELKHDGTDWGDDGKINIVDNQTTMPDENGNTVLVGTAQIVEPLGWIKNDK